MSDTPLHIPALIEMGKWHDYRKGIWGNSYTWDTPRTPQTVKYLVIHHTVTKHEATPDDIAALHKARGWAGIGYHFVITKDGMVHYVGDVGMARANVLNKNHLVIGIALVGDFTKHNPSDEQIISAHELCKFFLFSAPPWTNINGWEDVVGHKELQSTACPGTNWKGPVDSVYNRIKGRIPYTPEVETPQPTPMPAEPATPVPPVVPTPPVTPPEPAQPPPVVIITPPVYEDDYGPLMQIFWRFCRVFMTVFCVSVGEALSSPGITSYETARAVALACVCGSVVAAAKSVREWAKEHSPELYEQGLKKLPF
jgi:hypothetical protein